MSTPKFAAATARPRPRMPTCCVSRGLPAPLSAPPSVPPPAPGGLCPRAVAVWLRGRLLGLRDRSLWLDIPWRGWPGGPPRWLGHRGTSVAIPVVVREPRPLVAGSLWQPPRRGRCAGLVLLLAHPPRTGVLGRVSGGEWAVPHVLEYPSGILRVSLGYPSGILRVSFGYPWGIVGVSLGYP